MNKSQRTEKKLMELQKQYLNTKSDKVASEIYHTCYPYIKSIILKKFRHKIKIDKLDYYIENTLTLLFYEYLKNPEFRITDSFGGYLFNKVRQSIYGKAERDVGVYYKVNKEQLYDSSTPDLNKDLDWKKEKFKKVEIIPSISLNYTLPDGNEVEYIDQKNVIDEVELDRDKHIIKDNVLELIFLIDEYCNSTKESWFRYMAMYLLFHKGEKKVDKFFEVFSRMGKIKYKESFEILKEFLDDDYKIERSTNV